MAFSLAEAVETEGSLERVAAKLIMEFQTVSLIACALIISAIKVGSVGRKRRTLGGNGKERNPARHPSQTCFKQRLQVRMGICESVSIKATHGSPTTADTTLRG